MNNEKKYEIKTAKAMMIKLPEFTKIVEEATDGLKTVEYEFGPFLVDTEKAESSETYENREPNTILSNYFGVKVTSFHSDDCEFPLVYIIYEDDKEECSERMSCREVVNVLSSSDTVIVYSGASILGRCIAEDLLDDDEYFTMFDYDFREWPAESFDIEDDLCIIHVKEM